MDGWPSSFSIEAFRRGYRRIKVKVTPPQLDKEYKKLWFWPQDLKFDLKVDVTGESSHLYRIRWSVLSDLYCYVSKPLSDKRSLLGVRPCSTSKLAKQKMGRRSSSDNDRAIQ